MLYERARTKWICEHVSYNEDDCLIWPFSRNRGYGNLKYGDKIHYAHRVMCTLAHGDPPTPKHEAAHSCGNGRNGCVNPKHLSWKTRAENHDDAFKHGTAYTPRGLPRAKLTKDKAIEIHSLKGVLSQNKIAKQFGVTYSTVSKIHRGELWSHATLADSSPTQQEKA